MAAKTSQKAAQRPQVFENCHGNAEGIKQLTKITELDGACQVRGDKKQGGGGRLIANRVKGN